jgi:hypothetical protein
MATVIFTMKNGDVLPVEGVTPIQASGAWWHWSQHQDNDPTTVKLLGEGSDVRDVRDVEVRLTPEEAAAGQWVHGVRQPSLLDLD